MTPDEAREIDKQEFEAECEAIRQRLYVHLLKVNGHREPRVQRWIERGYEPLKLRRKPQPTPRPITSIAFTGGRPGAIHEAFNQRRTIEDWSSITGLSVHTIRTRLRSGWQIEDALTKAPIRTGKPTHKVNRAATPGVVSDLAGLEGTGAGSTVQEAPNIDFFEKAN